MDLNLNPPAQWVRLKDVLLQPHYTERVVTCHVATGSSAKLKVFIKCNHRGIEKKYANPGRLRRHSSGTAALCVNSNVKGSMGGWKTCTKVPPATATDLAELIRAKEYTGQAHRHTHRRPPGAWEGRAMEGAENTQKYSKYSRILETPGVGILSFKTRNTRILEF